MYASGNSAGMYEHLLERLDKEPLPAYITTKRLEEQRMRLGSGRIVSWRRIAVPEGDGIDLLIVQSVVETEEGQLALAAKGHPALTLYNNGTLEVRKPNFNRTVAVPLENGAAGITRAEMRIILTGTPEHMITVAEKYRRALHAIITGKGYRSGQRNAGASSVW